MLFDFIEEMHEKANRSNGRSATRESAIAAEMITVAYGLLFPLATRGGPLWQPFCYASAAGCGHVHHFVIVPVL